MANLAVDVSIHVVLNDLWAELAVSKLPFKVFLAELLHSEFLGWSLMAVKLELSIIDLDSQLLLNFLLLLDVHLELVRHLLYGHGVVCVLVLGQFVSQIIHVNFPPIQRHFPRINFAENDSQDPLSVTPTHFGLEMASSLHRGQQRVHYMPIPFHGALHLHFF